MLTKEPNVNLVFPHRQTAHCESGVIANLLTYHGLPLSEAMAFGIGGGLFFGYLPFIKINGLPLTTFRTTPGSIFSRVTKRLGIGVTSCTFRDQGRAMAELDRYLAQGVPVGMQTGVYWLPYFPPALRFHFNAHNLVAYGKQGDDYLISDPVIGEPVVCAAADLVRARFAQGALAPKGKMYSITSVPNNPDLTPAIKQGIREVSRLMVSIPFPLFGTWGIRYLANQVERWPAKLGDRKAILYLGNLIRMQEEIGTGGAGFRFIFAAFLQESADILGNSTYLEMSQRMTAIGDVWREFAVAGARHCKGRAGQGEDFSDLARIMRRCAELESVFFTDLSRLVRNT
jgi:hypothetical protein